MKRLGCRWVGTCASSSDASPLYIHDRSNVVQWKGSSLPSSQCTSSDQCIFGKMCSDESENRDFSSWHVIRIRIGPGYVRLIFMVINFVDIYIHIYAYFFFSFSCWMDYECSTQICIFHVVTEEESIWLTKFKCFEKETESRNQKTNSGFVFIDWT